MRFTFNMYDNDTNRQVEITQGEVEYLGDLIEAMLNFIQASGYTYVTNLTASAADGKEWSSL